MGEGLQMKNNVVQVINKWQPIETAPKDGTSVLLSVTYPYDHDNMAVAKYIDGRWIYDEDNLNEYCHPTHWMPLPSPPTYTGAQE